MHARNIREYFGTYFLVNVCCHKSAIMLMLNRKCISQLKDLFQFNKVGL